ncbi:MAG TPA: fluoride efflux transporter CrcB [Solirubrobacteraceae bacterium]|nr:fluoride efflux transporter CrcB [Solirubrobacteraceae bacterium]
MSAPTWVGVAVLGGFGAISRFLLDGVIGSAFGVAFPIGTFVINITGAFLLGLVTGLAFHGAALVLAGTATLGSYTTFSTWMLETHRLREDGEFVGAFANTLLSLAVGVGAVALGRAIGVHA